MHILCAILFKVNISTLLNGSKPLLVPLAADSITWKLTK